MKRSRLISIFLCTLFLALSSGVSAQTITYRLQWDENAPATEVAGYSFALKVDASTTPTPLTPTCAAISGVPGVQTRCVVDLPLLPVGPHTLVITATNAFGTSSSDPLNGSPASKPGGVTIIIKIT